MTELSPQGKETSLTLVLGKWTQRLTNIGFSVADADC